MTDSALAGCGVLVTRPAHQADELAEAIESAGARAIRFPVIEIIGRDEDVVANEFAVLPDPDIVIFVSQNAATFGGGVCALTKAEIGAIGPSTKAALEARGIEVRIAPQDGFTSEHLLEHPLLSNVDGKKVTIVRGEHGRRQLGDELRRRGATVNYLSAYRRQIRQAPKDEIIAIDEMWRRGAINYVIVLSVGTLENLLQLLLPTSIAMLRDTPLVAPGARVIQTAMKLVPGLQVKEASGPATSDILNALYTLQNSGQH